VIIEITWSYCQTRYKTKISYIIQPSDSWSNEGVFFVTPYSGSTGSCIPLFAGETAISLPEKPHNLKVPMPQRLQTRCQRQARPFVSG
ncbi:TPA: hypothetical protein ACHOVJ_004951, partial [Escherichia coli]